ncbi:sugar ABC transporter permease [Microbacterium sp. EYE_5]|uniref:sugar ABC transporter permease n=1 Tax=unclassified Microbacterium TaxID=2609290 RepID=UPI002005957D|nr:MULTISPECIES: sugar ABC transporter permease [unclassified Microbacterium]MCK6081182.1 sugar ABC transporter permease [Microbacterium sp. EYE_382]MCK6086452.1 sugar ABC transporter permease [Microbacterium sp. EYE_384]MCK6124050.1 sugar ABC transporter permease [Microbacterium sp. EYE_80]MCK6126959.1 sugar ABC transporter permease [Microbacterium sp. EYE_79]MCK6142137.1 sugar ABC transporter permease [Microbacterium sp. EYE_39]
MSPEGGVIDRVVARVRAGDVGRMPVVASLVVIAIVFQALNPVFLTSRHLSDLLMQCAAIGTISLGIVLVLLIGEIDLSVGSMSGVAAAILAVAGVQQGWPIALAVVAAIAAGCVVGAVFGFLRTTLGLPSFVVTLAGLLGLLGVQLWILGDAGSVNIPFDSWIVQFAQQAYLPDWLAYVLAVLTAVAYTATLLRRAQRRAAADLESSGAIPILIRGSLLLIGLVGGCWYLGLSRGVGVMFALFVVFVVIAHLALTRTRWGRSVYAVGGSIEAARRAGIRVDRVVVSVFMLCSALAATGGVLAAAKLGAANQSSGAADANLNAIAAAIIGGASLFGGRGSAFAALLGVVVIQAISAGLTLVNLSSAVQFMVTGGVLLFAVALDALTRRTRATSGRA